jgi:4-amino-4-deoxy-L-arabinose transferase-like glycosyltransferase
VRPTDPRLSPARIAGARLTGGEDQEAAGGRLTAFAWRPVCAVAAILAAVLIATSSAYGYHRDELYFLACARHLAWGYPDQPLFVPLIARLMSDLAPTSLVVLRLPSALAAVAVVVLTGLIARELGGGRGAQLLAASAIAISALLDASGHTLNTNIFDLAVWALVCWLVVRILRTGRERLWLVVGLVVGLGLFDSDLVAFLMFAVVVALALVGPRSAFTSPWLYAGGLLAIVMWLPYLAWQAGHGWPELTVARSIANGGSGTSAPRWLLLPEQLVLVSLFLSPVWIAGLLRLFRDSALRRFRALGVAYFVAAATFIITGGKPYYLGGMLPLLVAAGAEPLLRWLRRGRVGLRRALIVAAFVLTLGALPVTPPLVPAGDLHNTSVVKLNYDAGETVGWPTYVRQIARVDNVLPLAARPATVVLASNYGEAGAVDRYGPADGLPAAYSGHNAYWYWGPPPVNATTAIVLGFDRDQLVPFCGTLRLATTLNNHLDLNNDEQGAPVWECSNLRESWAAVWPALRHFG